MARWHAGRAAGQYGIDHHSHQDHRKESTNRSEFGRRLLCSGSREEDDRSPQGRKVRAREKVSWSILPQGRHAEMGFKQPGQKASCGYCPPSRSRPVSDGAATPAIAYASQSASLEVAAPFCFTSGKDDRLPFPKQIVACMLSKRSPAGPQVDPLHRQLHEAPRNRSSCACCTFSPIIGISGG